MFSSHRFQDAYYLELMGGQTFKSLAKGSKDFNHFLIKYLLSTYYFTSTILLDIRHMLCGFYTSVPNLRKTIR